MAVLGIDIGGTKIAAGLVSLVDGEARVERSIEVPTRAAEGYAISRAQVDAAIQGLLGADVEAIGICAPGPLDPLTGVVLNPPNLPGWRNIPLRDEIATTYGLPCGVENDANAAGLAEARFGAGRGMDPVFYATLSTGIGTGVVIGGKVFHGRHGASAEGGHVSIDYRSETICECGVRGCIEVLASGTAIVRRARAMGLPGIEHAGDVAASQDPRAWGIMEETTDMLAAWLGGMITLFDPAVIVLGGGVTQVGTKLFCALRAKVRARTLNPHVGSIPIVPAALGRNCGLIGAAAAFLR